MNRLEEIVARRRRDLDRMFMTLPQPVPIRPVARPGAFGAALGQPGLSVIAEIKRQSPSKGPLAPIEDVAALAGQYASGGAAAFSVLTEPHYFKGSLADLEAVTDACPQTPVLMKDFVVDPRQLPLAHSSGAAAVLLIAGVLGRALGTFLQHCTLAGLDALVEVHDAREIELALSAGARIIGINSRDLRDFTVDLQRATDLVSLLPAGVVKVAESGIRTPQDAARMAAAGFDAVLVGEALVVDRDPAALIRALRGREA